MTGESIGGGSQAESTPPPVGEVVGSADSTLPVETDDQGRLAEDVACRRCQYNLRGLTLEGACPECRLAISETLHDGLLRFADARWLGRLSVGLVLLIVAIIAGVVATVGNQMAMLRAFTQGSFSFDTAEPQFLPLITTTLMIAITGLQAVAIVFVTLPEPGRARQERFFNGRFMARTAILVAIIFGAVAAIANPMLHVAITGQFTEAVVAEWMMMGCVLLSWGCRGIGILALAAYGFSLAARVPADKLARFLRRSAQAYVGAGAILTLVMIAANLNLVSGARSVVLELMLILGGTFLLISGIAGIVLMVLMRNHLKTARRLAARREQRLHSGDLA